jgi:hypothetical protein
MFTITLDMDWVPPELIYDASKLLNDFGINATFFVTNKIDFTPLKKHELAIHPNFTTNNLEDTLKKTISILPTKKTSGSRSHKLFNSMELMLNYKKFGIKYDSNYYLPNILNPQPILFEQSDVLEIPFFFGDDTFFGTTKKFNLNEINLNDVGVKVFLFHPFHIFANTYSKNNYEKMKPFYHDFDLLNNKRNLNIRGTRNLFLELLEHIENNQIETYTMEEVNKIWRKKLIKN